MKSSSETPRFRELFIDELEDVHAGASGVADPCCTTMACCEEGPFGCCDILPLDAVDVGP